MTTQSKYGEGKKKAVVAVHTKSGKTAFQTRTVGTKAKEKKQHWFDKYKQYNLNVYPVGLQEKDVEVNVEGDTDSHWILRWKDGKTGKVKRAYTREFLKRNAEVKWERITSISEDQIEVVKGRTISNLKNEKLSEKEKDKSAVIAIIAFTGLRVGQRKNFEETGNRGVTTLAKSNIKINGNTISLDFVGKSYQQNTAEIKNRVLADYLKGKLENLKDEDFVFNVSRAQVDDHLKNDLGLKENKIKDFRTYFATQKATEILAKEAAKIELPEKKTEKRKTIKTLFNGVCEKVSELLNNTPAMAKNSYIHPVVFNTFLINLGLNEEFLKGLVEEKKFTLCSVIEVNPVSKKKLPLIVVDDEQEAEDLDILFELPVWYEEIEKSEKYVEWKTVQRSTGKVFQQRFQKKTEKVEQKPPRVTDNEYTNLLSQLMFGHFYEGKFYDKNGNVLKLTPKEYKYAQQFHKKEGLRRDLGGLYIASKELSQPNITKDQIKSEDFEKYKKKYDKTARLFFITKIKPKIDELSGLKKQEKKIKNQQAKRHIETDRIVARIKDSIKRVNTGYSYKPHKMLREPVTGINIIHFKNLLENIQGQLKRDVQITYKLDGQEQNEPLSKTLERVKNKITLNENGNQIAFNGWFVSKNELPLPLTDFSIDVDSLNEGDFSKKPTVLYKLQKIRKANEAFEVIKEAFNSGKVNAKAFIQASKARKEIINK